MKVKGLIFGPQVPSRQIEKGGAFEEACPSQGITGRSLFTKSRHTFPALASTLHPNSGPSSAVSEGRAGVSCGVPTLVHYSLWPPYWTNHGSLGEQLPDRNLLLCFLREACHRSLCSGALNLITLMTNIINT